MPDAKPDGIPVVCNNCSKTFYVDPSKIQNAKLMLVRMLSSDETLYIVSCTNCGAPTEVTLKNKDGKQ